MPRKLIGPEGFQAYTKQELRERAELIPKNTRKQLCIAKDEKPSWLKGKWKQTYSYQSKKFMKELKMKCELLK